MSLLHNRILRTLYAHQKRHGLARSLRGGAASGRSIALTGAPLLPKSSVRPPSFRSGRSSRRTCNAMPLQGGRGRRCGYGGKGLLVPRRGRPWHLGSERERTLHSDDTRGFRPRSLQIWEGHTFSVKRSANALRECGCRWELAERAPAYSTRRGGFARRSLQPGCRAGTMPPSPRASSRHSLSA